MQLVSNMSNKVIICPEQASNKQLPTWPCIHISTLPLRCLVGSISFRCIEPEMTRKTQCRNFAFSIDGVLCTRRAQNWETIKFSITPGTEFEIAIGVSLRWSHRNRVPAALWLPYNPCNFGMTVTRVTHKHIRRTLVRARSRFKLQPMRIDGVQAKQDTDVPCNVS